LPHKRTIKEKLLKGGVWAFSGKVLTSILGLVINVLLARLLTPEEMGAYFLLFAIIAFFTTLGQMGVSQVVLRRIASSLGTENEGKIPKLVYFSLLIALLASSCLALLLSTDSSMQLASQVFHSSAVNYGLSVALFLVVVMSLQSLTAEIYRGFHDVRLATIFGGLSTSVLTACLLALAWFLLPHFDLRQALLLTLSAAGLSLVFSLFGLWNKLKELHGNMKFDDHLGLFRSSFPLLLYGLLYFVLDQSPLLLVGMFSSSEQAALYGASAKLVLLVTMPLLIVNAVIPPIIAELNRKGDLQKLEQVLRASATFAGIPAMVVLLILTIFSDEVMGLVYGQFYTQGAMILTVLCLGQMINVWAGSCGLTLVYAGFESLIVKITMVTALITVSLGTLFLQLGWGAVGMAVSATLGMGLQNILMLYYTKKEVGVWTHMIYKVSVLKNIVKIIK